VALILRGDPADKHLSRERKKECRGALGKKGFTRRYSSWVRVICDRTYEARLPGEVYGFKRKLVSNLFPIPRTRATEKGSSASRIQNC